MPSDDEFSSSNEEQEGEEEEEESEEQPVKPAKKLKQHQPQGKAAAKKMSLEDKLKSIQAEKLQKPTKAQLKEKASEKKEKRQSSKVPAADLEALALQMLQDRLG